LIHKKEYVLLYCTLINSNLQTYVFVFLAVVFLVVVFFEFLAGEADLLLERDLEGLLDADFLAGEGLALRDAERVVG
jgi:hypothetical protein